VLIRGAPVPFKSQAQRRKFAQLLVEGKISDQTFEEWNRETGGKVLPERVGKKTAGRKQTARRKKTVSRKKTTSRKKTRKRKTAA
jgi:hypothetical protein